MGWSDIEKMFQDYDENKLKQKWSQLMKQCHEKEQKVVIVICGLNKLSYGGVEKKVQVRIRN